jgi:hypothetical protein
MKKIFRILEKAVYWIIFIIFPFEIVKEKCNICNCNIETPFLIMVNEVETIVCPSCYFEYKVHLGRKDPCGCPINEGIVVHGDASIADNTFG